MADPSEQIRQRAYELWQLAGSPEDREQEFWYEAERELQNSDTTDCPNEKSGSFTEPTSSCSRGCGLIFDTFVTTVALFAMSAMFLSLAFARYVHRAAT